jgi:hypothetical protein
MKYKHALFACFFMITCSFPLSAEEMIDNWEPSILSRTSSASQDTLEAKLNIPLPSETPGPEVKKEIPFQVGERLKYSVGWGKVLDAGTATINVKDIIDYQGHAVYPIVVEAKSNAVFSLFYRVRDTLESLIDVEGLFSRRYWTKQDEAYEKSERKYEFDQENNVAHYKGKDYYIRYGIQDEVSAVFYVRTLDLQVGQPVYVDIFARGKNWQVKCDVLAIETIEVPAGKFETILVEPELRFDGVMKKGKIKVWLTNDAHRIPVQVRSKIAIGSILIRLVDYRLGTKETGGK